MSGMLTWKEFIKEAKEFLRLSEKFHDSWTLIEKDPSEAQTYLVYRQRILVNIDYKNKNEVDELTEDLESSSRMAQMQSTEQLINVEYHLVYSLSYQVPVLYFKANKSDGSLISLEDSWQLFSDPTAALNPTKAEMLSILTQMDHPILFRPFLALHPCRTAELLGIASKSKNRIVTFLSLMGPYVRLNLKTEYGIHFNE